MALSFHWGKDTRTRHVHYWKKMVDHGDVIKDQWRCRAKMLPWDGKFMPVQFTEFFNLLYFQNIIFKFPCLTANISFWPMFRSDDDLTVSLCFWITISVILLNILAVLSILTIGLFILLENIRNVSFHKVWSPRMKLHNIQGLEEGWVREGYQRHTQKRKQHLVSDNTQ